MNKVKVHLLILISLLIYSCSQVKISDCECNKMLIYGNPNCGVLTPISISKESVKNESFVEIQKTVYRDSIINELQKLKRTNGGYGVDNRFLIEIQCKDSTIIEVESNCYLSMYNKKYYKVTDEFVELIKRAIKNNENNN